MMNPLTGALSEPQYALFKAEGQIRNGQAAFSIIFHGANITGDDSNFFNPLNIPEEETGVHNGLSVWVRLHAHHPYTGYYWYSATRQYNDGNYDGVAKNSIGMYSAHSYSDGNGEGNDGYLALMRNVTLNQNKLAIYCVHPPSNVVNLEDGTAVTGGIGQPNIYVLVKIPLSNSGPFFEFTKIQIDNPL